MVLPDREDRFHLLAVAQHCAVHHDLVDRKDPYVADIH